MATYTFSADANQEAGITAAREAYNDGLPDSEEAPRAEHPDYKATNADYVAFVLSRATESYQRQYGVGAFAS